MITSPVTLSTATLSTAAWRVRLITLITWLALLMLVILRQLLPASNSLWLALLYSLPLLAPLPGLLRGHRYTYSWATLCVLPYFIVGVTETVANPALHLWASALLGASLLWFFSLISFLRFTRPA